MSRGHCVVAGILVGLEQCRFLPQWSTSGHRVLQCVRRLGLRGVYLEWLQLSWPAPWMEVPIAAKEAVPIVASLAVWGNRWAGGTVPVFCDNMAVVQCLRTGSAKNPLLNHLFGCWSCSSPSSRYLSVRNTFPACRTARQMHCRKIMLCYFSHFSHRPPGFPRWSRSLSQPYSSTRRAPGYPKSGWRGSVSVCQGSLRQFSKHVCGWKEEVPVLLRRGKPEPAPGLGGDALPLCRLVAHLATAGLRAQSISGYLSALWHLSIEVGLQPLRKEECSCLSYVLKGVNRSQAASGRPRRLLITPAILLSLKAVWESGSVDFYSARLLWAMSLSAFFGCFRIGELTVQDTSSPTAVEVADVSFEGSPIRAKIHLRFSKTDPSGSGANVFLGFTGGPLCPVTALGNYLRVRPPGPGPLFVSADGRPVSRATFVTGVRVALSSARVDSEGYTGHSFRVSAAMVAARVGIPTHLIKAMGRWSSDAFMVYLRLSLETLAGLTPVLARPPS